jgi:hypothetical protein
MSKRKDLKWTVMTQFSLSARVSSHPEKSAKSRMLMAVKRVVLPHVAKAKKG